MEPRVDLFLSRCREIFGRRRGAPRVGENEAREIARLREAGLTLGEVGRILNRPESTVRCVELRAKRNLASGFARSCDLTRTGWSGVAELPEKLEEQLAEAKSAKIPEISSPTRIIRQIQKEPGIRRVFGTLSFCESRSRFFAPPEGE